MEWQKIETAPRDEKIMLAVFYDGKWFVDCGMAVKKGYRKTMVVGFRKNEYPTHWMPLPEPPKGESK